MFSEPQFSSVSAILSIPIFPISSKSTSLSSTASHARTSTITLNSYLRSDVPPSLPPPPPPSPPPQSNITENYFQQQPQYRQMKIGKYFLEKTIGKGNFAVVKLATHCDTQQKVFNSILIDDLNPGDHKKLEREIAVMKSLIHPYIIRLYEVMESKNLIYLVTEYAANGELLDLLIREKRLSEPKAKEKFRQLVLAVEYIHSKNIVHRDLKAENLLLDSQGNIKVADVSDLTCQTQLVPNCQLTNAILDHAESLGYNRAQILKSVNGNSYDSDAAIWHLLLEKFQQACQIDNSHIPFESVLPDDMNNSDMARRSTAPLIFHENNTELIYSAPDTTKSIRPQLDPCDLQRTSKQVDDHKQEPEIRMDYHDCYDEDDKDHDGEEDDVTSAQLREQYTRTRGLRRHTIGRPELLVHGGPIPILASKVRFALQASSLEPALLSNRLTNLQQQQNFETIRRPHNDDESSSISPPMPSIFQQKDPYSTSFNGYSGHSSVINNKSLDVHDHRQQDTHELSPPISHNFHMNRRASDSGAHLLLFQQQYGVTGSNTFGAVLPTYTQSPLSNRSSRGSITRGAPITPPTFSITPHEAEEDEEDKQQKPPNEDDDDAEVLTRYLNLGKRHTVCEQGLLLCGKARRGGTREPTKERGLLSRRASDTSSNFMNGTARAHLERLYNNAVDSKPSDDDLTASSLQELQKLKKQVQKYPTNNNDTSMVRRAAAIPSPTNSAGLHMIQEEHQQNPLLLSSNCQYSNQNKSSSSSSSEGLANIDDDDNEMDCDVHHYYHHRTPQFFGPSHYHPPPPTSSLFHCNTNPLLAQHLTIPTTTSYMP
ncbi:unnamed protein product [Rotaria magnacalcarata]|uniref:non-specific serine/threonine protein kinase n=1 Tax=Rotaria magnacalcarata TaxID=392030 RepID=A0A819R5Q7_9BILA|nr:unnamed protein product [Rotaria magnacalcarata]